MKGEQPYQPGVFAGAPVRIRILRQAVLPQMGPDRVSSTALLQAWNAIPDTMLGPMPPIQRVRHMALRFSLPPVFALYIYQQSQPHLYQMLQSTLQTGEAKSLLTAGLPSLPGAFAGIHRMPQILRALRPPMEVVWEYSPAA